MENPEFENVECCTCGVAFGMTSYLKSSRKSDKKMFYCPNGHGQSYTKSTEEYLKEQVNDLSAKNSRLIYEKTDLAIKNGKLEKKLRRAKQKVNKK